MYIFRRRSLKLTEPSQTIRVRYLGNVSTDVAKGDRCIDTPLGILWTNYEKTCGRRTVSMNLSIDNSGLKVYTKSQGETRYWCHRITYYCASKRNPKVFVWIYRHMAKNLKVDLRCHAAMCRNEKTAKYVAEHLSEKVSILKKYRYFAITFYRNSLEC